MMPLSIELRLYCTYLLGIFLLQVLSDQVVLQVGSFKGLLIVVSSFVRIVIIFFTLSLILFASLRPLLNEWFRSYFNFNLLILALNVEHLLRQGVSSESRVKLVVNLFCSKNCFQSEVLHLILTATILRSTCTSMP